MTPAVILPPAVTIRTGTDRYWFLPILQPEQVKLVVAAAEKGRG
jgi:hypothetical protein